MKVFASTIFVLLLAGCSPETISENSSDNVQGASPIYKKQGLNIPANPTNAYDHIGTIYYQLLDAYYAADPGSPGLQEVISQVEVLAYQHAAFSALADLPAYEAITPADINPYLQINGGDIRQYLAPAYGAAAKALYAALGEELTSLKIADATYQEAYEAIVQAEEAINANHSLSASEREAMLTTTSILRNAYYHDGKKRRRDRDWEWMTGHVAATANAALDSKPQAIIVSLTIDIYQM